MADNVFDLLKKAWSVARTDDASIFGVEIAIVTNVKDPDQQGRVKICFPRLPGKPESDWARLARPAAGDGRGFYWIPSINDEVLVAFERGQANRPYVIGSLWNGKDKPMQDAYSDENSKLMVQSASGHQIIVEDKDGAESIVIADKSGKRAITWSVKDKKFLIEAKEGDVELHAKGRIVLQCEDVEIKTTKTGKIDIGDKFELKVAQKAGFKAGPQINLKADKVNLNPPSLDLAALVAAALAKAAAEAAAAAGANQEQQRAAAGAAGAAAAAATGGAGGDLSSDVAADGTSAAGTAADVAQKGGAAAPDGTDFTKAGDKRDSQTGPAASAAQDAAPGEPTAEKAAAANAPAASAAPAAATASTGESVATQVSLVDARDRPAANIPWKFSLPDGAEKTGTTAADGIIAIQSASSGKGRLELFLDGPPPPEPPPAPEPPPPGPPDQPPDSPAKPGAASVKTFVGRSGTEEGAEVDVAAGDDIELSWEVANATGVRLFRVREGSDVADAMAVPALEGGKGKVRDKPDRPTTYLLFALDDSVRLDRDAPAGAPASPVTGPMPPSVTATPAPPQLRNFAFLDHFVATGSGVQRMTPALMDPHLAVAASGGLAAGVAALLQAKPQYHRATGLQFAVADLTRDPDHPELAGTRLDEHWETASSGKTMIMYAAFQLRADLQELARRNPSVQTAADLFALARGEWGKTQQRVDPPAAMPVAPGNNVTLELAGRLVLLNGKPIPGPVNSAPRLENIFAVKPGAAAGDPLQVDFIRNPQRQTDDDIWKKVLASNDSSPLGDLTFFERVALMIDESSNNAARLVEQDLGFLYMNSVFWQSGLYDPARGGGLWMGRFYLKGDQLRVPVPSPTPRTPDGQEIFAGTTARAYVSMMSLLAQGRLVNAASCAQMKQLMDRSMEYGAQARSPKDRSQNRSPIGDALHFAGRKLKLDEVFAKIGIGGRNNIWDVALVKRTTAAGRQITYAITCMDCEVRATDSEDGILSQIVRDLDELVEKANP